MIAQFPHFWYIIMFDDITVFIVHMLIDFIHNSLHKAAFTLLFEMMKKWCHPSFQPDRLICFASCLIAGVLWRRNCWKYRWSSHIVCAVNDVMLTGRLLHGITQFIGSLFGANKCGMKYENWRFIFIAAQDALVNTLQLLSLVTFCSSIFSWTYGSLGTEIKLDFII